MMSLTASWLLLILFWFSTPTLARTLPRFRLPHFAPSSSLFSPFCRRHHVNKIETVRILRARPAFYPAAVVKVASAHPAFSRTSVSSAASSASPEGLESITGHAITLKADRSELKRKRRHPKTPATINL